ncbi:MAG: MaoC family dehydratase N-terminal domain-containing protein [Nevskia sp.]
MAIDRAHLGYALPAFTVEASRERIAAFRRAVGLPVPEHGELLAPPTFMKAVEGEHNSSRRILDALGVDLRRVLHAEQQFDYFAPIRAGDRLRVQRSVTALYEKKNGALEFIVIESDVRRDDGAATPVGKSRQVVLVRKPAPVTAA